MTQTVCLYKVVNKNVGEIRNRNSGDDSLIMVQTVSKESET